MTFSSWEDAICSPLAWKRPSNSKRSPTSMPTVIPAGELKHGPIALIDANFPVIAFCANQKTEEKIVSNLQEVKARGAPYPRPSPENLKIVAPIADDVIWLPPTTDELSPFSPRHVAGQLSRLLHRQRNGTAISTNRETSQNR